MNLAGASPFPTHIPAALWPGWMRAMAARVARGTPDPLDLFWLRPALVMEQAGDTPDPWQRRLLESHWQRLLVCCGRQFGKSAAVGALVVRTALVEAPATVLILSASQRQSAEFFSRHVVRLMQRLKWPVRPARVPNVFSLELVNGSRIIALPDSQESIVGYSAVDLLVIDEASRVSDDLYHYTKPMLATSRGRMVASSTPYGKRGWFFEQWEGGRGWQRHQALAPPAGEGCPRISAAFLAEELREKGPRRFGQEYLGSFLDTVDALIPGADIAAALRGEAAPLFQPGEFGDAW